ncbi:MAG TPA: DUF3488 and transglutaminase-like domain-containing protein [Acidimicrobiales bacterium]|nr:DUF3488 and transglutaminase-like domain-containing protein [Acidimicrobiales bacterium]
MTVLAAVKRANAKAPPESSVALRVAVLVAVEAATLATLAQGVGGVGVRVAATVGIAVGFAYSHWARFREGYALKAALAVGVLLAFANFLSAVTGLSAGAINEVQIPLAELFLWVQFLHSIDVPARRDLLFSLVSSLVLMAVAGVLSTSTALGGYLAVWALAAVASLVLAYRSEVSALPALGRSGTPGAVTMRPRSGALRPVVAAAALVAVVATVVFLVVPAAGAGKAVAFPARLPHRVGVPGVGGLANPSLGGADPQSPDGRTSSRGTGASSFGYFGFSNQLDTSARGRPDDTLVLKVKASRPDFWRGQTFDTWDGRTWTQSDQRVRAITGESPLQIVAPPDEQGVGAANGADFVQTVYVEAGGPNLVFAAYAPAQLHIADSAVFEMTDGTIRTGAYLDQGAVYTVVSRRPAVTEDLLRAAEHDASGTPASIAQRYTQLPASTPARVRELAATLAAGSTSRYDVVRAYEAWMRDNTSYTLDIPKLPAGDDAVDRYLFVDRQGFCEQIASALVVMLRSQGIPARLAVGYAPGQRNPFTGMFEVRASDAHSWAEVWFPGIGWQPFDPTAQVPLAGDPYSSAAGTGLARYLRAHLPSVPAGVVRAGAVAVGVLVPLLTLGWLVLLALRRARERRRRPWPDRMLERLERAGTARGRSRRHWESARRYADVLRVSVFPDERLRAVADVIEAATYGPPGGMAPDDHAMAERLLADAEAAHPVR